MYNGVRVIKNLIKFLVILGILVMLFYIIFTLSFYELHLQCKLAMKDIYFKAKQITFEANQKAEKLLMEKKAEAYCMFIYTLEKEIPHLRKAKKKGFKNYIKAYLKYRRTFKNAKKQYRNKIIEAKREALKIKKEAKREIKKLVKEAKKNLDPLNLLIKNILNKKTIKGYLYNPKKGKIIPRTY
jgi:hypothetical protein